MFLSDIFNKKVAMPTPEKALRGRPDPIPTSERHYESKRPLKAPYPDGLEIATFGLGCFWGAERLSRRPKACG